MDVRAPRPLSLVERPISLITKILECRGFDSSRILISRRGIFMSLGNFPEVLSQRILVGIILVARLGVTRSISRSAPLRGRPKESANTILYYTILYYTILYYTILYYTILYTIYYILYTIYYILYIIYYNYTIGKHLAVTFIPTPVPKAVCGTRTRKTRVRRKVGRSSLSWERGVWM